MPTFLFALVPLLLALVACTEPPPADPAPPGRGPLVVDLVAVAKALGRDEVMEQQLQRAQDSLAAQLQAVGVDLQAQLKQHEAQLKEAGEKDAEDRLQALTREANRKLQQTQLAANQQAQAYRNQLIRSFQDEVRGVAREIAQGQGARVVVSAEAGLLWFDPQVDITDEVIAALRARSQAASKRPPSDPGPADPAPATDPAAVERETRKLEQLMDELSSAGQGPGNAAEGD